MCISQFSQKQMASSSTVIPAVLNHYDVPSNLPSGDFKAKCKHCPKDITDLLNFSTSLVLKYCLKYFMKYLSTLSFSAIVLVLNIAPNVRKVLSTFKCKKIHM